MEGSCLQVPDQDHHMDASGGPGRGLVILLAVSAGITLPILPIRIQCLSGAPIGAAAWGGIVSVVLVGYLVGELEKWLRCQKGAAPAAKP